MKYYSISWDYDNLEVIGHYPQTSLKKGYNPSLPDSHWAVKPHSFPDFIPNLELELHKDANATDYLHFDDISGIIVSGKFRAVLKKFNLPPHAFYPIKVYHKGELLEYFWFHYIIDIWKYVDLENSSAQIYKKFEFEIDEIIPIPDLDNIQEYKKSLPRQKELRINKIFFKEEYSRYDVIKIFKIGYFGILFSEQLLNALKEEDIKGFIEKPIENIICK